MQTDNNHNYKFDNQEQIVYEDSYFGRGKGVVVGYFRDGEKEYYVIYPKITFDEKFWPYMTFILPPNKIISTPF